MLAALNTNPKTGNRPQQGHRCLANQTGIEMESYGFVRSKTYLHAPEHGIFITRGDGAFRLAAAIEASVFIVQI